MSQLRIEELKSKYQLSDHPEGGYYKELFRAEHCLENGRSTMTSIHYLLHDEHFSHFHTIDADECWYFHEGSTLEIHTIDDNNGHQVLYLGNEDGAQPFHLVKAGTIFGSRMKNGIGYALVSCAVSPGFEFAHFHLNQREQLLIAYPHLSEIIHALTR